MTTELDTIALTFPRSCTTVEDDRITVNLERRNIEALMAFPFAQQHGLIDCTGLRARGHG
jgi:hypothetical protein